MQRRFSLILLAALLTGAVTVGAQQRYDAVVPPVATDGAGQVEVLEFFWYGCPHCYAFHPHVDAWERRKPSNVKFRLVAAPLNPSWTPHARAYYAAEVLGVVPQFHDAFFNAIHKDRKRMRKPDEIAQFVEGIGLDANEFLETMNSFAVETRMRKAMQLAEAYGISGVPTVAVNGKFKTTASRAGGYAQMIDVLDGLVAQESGS